MAEVYTLTLMELLMQTNGIFSLENAWRHFLLHFPHTWDNFSDFQSFVHSQPMLFGVHNNYIFLKDGQTADSTAYAPHGFNSAYPFTQFHVSPLPPPPSHLFQPQNFAAEAEAVKYFQRQITRRCDSWVPIKSLAGHLSQASANIRAVVGPQSDFVYFLLRHPRIFEVQGDLVSLRDEVKQNYLSRQGTQGRHSSGRRNRPLSMFASSAVWPPVPCKNDVGDTVHSSQSVQNLSQHSQFSEQQDSSQTIFISVIDYAAAMWMRQTIERLGGTSGCPVLLDDLMHEFVSAPVNIRNSVGLTRIEVTEFLEKFSQLFEIDQTMCKSKVLDKATTTFVISDSASTKTNNVALTNKKGTVYCVSKSWGIIDLGQHEHVFFDRSLFKHVESLTKHFSVGETLCFNAILAPKESRAKWRATRVWKETDTLALRFSELALAPSSQPRDNCSSSTISTTPSEGNSDSGVQDATVQKPSSSLASAELEDYLNDPEFNVVRLDIDNTENLLALQEPEGLDDSDDEDGNIHDEKKAAVSTARAPKCLSSAGITEGDQSDDNTSSDLNTMSDIPSISSCFPAPNATGSFVSSGTQTYFTGDILARKVYHESVNEEQQND